MIYALDESQFSNYSGFHAMNLDEEFWKRKSVIKSQKSDLVLIKIHNQKYGE
jgi:hypothetical protein